MALRVFLDANVLLDFVLKRANYAVSRQIIVLSYSGDITAVTSPSVLHITAYWLTKEHGEKLARKILIALLNEITIVDADHDMATAALHSAIGDIEDGLQYFTALSHRVDFLLSWDKKFIKQNPAGLQVISPGDFLKSHFPGHYTK